MKQVSMPLIAAFGLGTLVSVLAITAWGSYYGWHLTPISAYVLFPLLGLVAYSLMWTHYAIAAGRDQFGVGKASLKPYFTITGWVVLVLILLHPGLLIYQRYRDGFGLPPHSYESYVAPGLGWVTLLGSASLLVFLAFELHRVWGDRKWWHWLRDSSDLAMLAIAYHSLRLGTQLHMGWFLYVWWFYIITLVLLLIRKYSLRYMMHRKSPAV
ncbi:MAG TPA: hypothetical protein VH234_06080 [Candidatus Saccharimonadales bacterium]|jgi:hypothetical protein|nr:hypothetical protein [Candidatus Saccharimonadales bacterium]